MQGEMGKVCQNYCHGRRNSTVYWKLLRIKKKFYVIFPCKNFDTQPKMFTWYFRISAKQISHVKKNLCTVITTQKHYRKMRKVKEIFVKKWFFKSRKVYWLWKFPAVKIFMRKKFVCGDNMKEIISYFYKPYWILIYFRKHLLFI